MNNYSALLKAFLFLSTGLAASTAVAEQAVDRYRHVLTAEELLDLSADPAYAAFVRTLPDDGLYIRIPLFHGQTSKQLQAALQTLPADAGLPQVVLDLRGNHGGLVNAAIEVADEFIGAGILAKTAGIDDTPDMLFKATPEGRLLGSRIVVLIDGQTASAAELLAGILRVNAGAILAGRNSYGKNAVQARDLQADGSYLAHTVAHYFFSDGSSVPEKGLQPDARWPGRIVNKALPRYDSNADRLRLDPALKRARLEFTKEKPR